MKLLKQITAFAAGLSIVAVTLIPSFSFAQSYVVSPSYIGTSSMSVAQANQTCMSLPDSVAATMSYCMYSGTIIPVATAGSIADQGIVITVTSPTSASITWQTSVPTSTVAWYSDSTINPTASVMSTNTAQGMTTYHSIVLTGMNLMVPHYFRVGGYDASNAAVMSGYELI